MELKITPSVQTIVKPTALGPVANTDAKLLIYWSISKGPSFGTGRDKANQVIIDLTCKKCNTVMKVQGNLRVQSPLLPGHLPFPANNKLQCPTCAVAHNLVQARQQVEAQSKKPLLTPPS